MKLSTMAKQLRALAKAIRKGAKRRPQTTGDLFTLDELKNGKYRLGESCALGAAYEGAFGKPPVRNKRLKTGGFAPKVDGGDEQMYKRLNKKFRVLTQRKRDEVDWAQTYSDLIISRNDTFGFTREDIADWLEEHAAELEAR